MDNSFFAFRAGAYLSSIAATMEASGPVRLKSEGQRRVEDEAMYAREARRLRNQVRLAREAEYERLTRPTPAEQERIARDQQRRATRKAEKKANKAARRR